METLVDFCRQKSFMTKIYANLDGDITCSSVFEDSVNLLLKNTFPVNYPLYVLCIFLL